MNDRRRLPPREVVILPSTGSGPRFSERLATEHDMNDAINARMDWIDRHQGLLKKKEEEISNKAFQKIMEGKQASAKKVMIWIFVILTISPIITYIEYLIYRRLTGSG